MRLPTKLFSLIFLAIFVSASLFLAPLSHAAGIFDLATQPKTIADYGKEFCDKRSGDLMNLETWYSGKCGAEVDTISGDGVGFSDIVILQGLEYLNGPQYDDFLTSIAKRLNVIYLIKQRVLTGEITPSQINLAEVKDGSLVAVLGGITAKIMTTKPASSLDYLAYVSNNLKNHHVINEAYAASPGYGFQSLAPILPLWRAFRNISYLLFALGFVLYGVMIMFRVKIDAKTAASIQLAIPKLIVTLLLITFSYAIVGFLIDISTVASAMVIPILKAGEILADVNNVLPFVAGGGTILGALGSWFVNGISAAIVAPFIFFNLIIGGLLGTAVATVVTAIINIGTLGIAGLLFGICIMLMVAYAYIKLIFKLFQAFFSIIVSLIFSPIILLGNLIPGSNSISTWLMTIVGNLAVFPVASFFLVLSYALMCQPLLSIIPTKLIGISIPGISISFNTQAAMENLLGVKTLSTFSNIWTPPMTIPGAGSVLTTGTWTGSVGSLMLATIGFGLLLMASKYVDMVTEALKVPPFKYGSAIGEALAVPAKVAKVGYKAVKEVVTLVKP